MTEKEFDIQVRNLLQNAQEPVSPKVWESVEAALNKPARVIPLRFWGYACALAAAAAVALFVFLKPAAPVVEPAHSNPSIFMSEASGETVPQTEIVPIQEETPVQLVQLPRRQPHYVAQADVEILSAPSGPRNDNPSGAERHRGSGGLGPQSVKDSLTKSQDFAPVSALTSQKPQEKNDQALFNQMAFEEEKASRPAESSFSFLAFGNVQGTQRGGIHGDFHRYGAPALNAGVGIYNETPEVSFSLPFSVGLGVQFNLNQRWALGTGIRYTNLQRTFVGDFKGEGFYLAQTDIDNQQHWLGVPVNVYYNFVNTNRWRVHAFAGGSAEWLLDNHFLIHSSPSDIHHHMKGEYTQWSGAVGLGVEFKITPFLGLYIDPSFRYFFNTERQPRSLRTIQPLRFDLEAGLRFSIGKK